MKNKPIFSFILALLLAYFLYGVGLAISAVFLSHTSLPQPSFMAHRVPHPLMDFLSSIIVLSGVAALSLVLRGGLLGALVLFDPFGVCPGLFFIRL